MPNYEAMYYALFNSLSDVIDILQKAQREAEQLFIEDADEANEETE